jgi:guanosine-3',5'-bis(diphosphate) 3'-pyrophosphohydrolase
MLDSAIIFAIKKHHNQFRKRSNIPYIIHPITVAFLAKLYKPLFFDFENIHIACILHDTIEDTDTTYNEILINFNIEIADLVLELTNNKQMINNLGKNEYVKQKCINLSLNALYIKLADRLSNIIDKPLYSYIVSTDELIRFIYDHRVDLEGHHIKLIRIISKKCNTEIQKYIESLN